MKKFWIPSLLIMITLVGCGRAPSKTLRQGQLPIYDFPLYLTEGIPGRVSRIDRDRTRTVLTEGLQDPRGVATDRFQNLYVVEYGAGRLLRFPAGEAPFEVMAENLQSPSVVAVDSFGEIYVAQDGPQNIIRISDGKIFGSYTTVPTALAFGVEDTPIVGLFNASEVFWSWTSEGPKTSIEKPVNASIDGSGRVYVAQGDAYDGRVYRYHQREPGEGKLVADNLLGPTGIAVDLIGNIFIVEQGASRIVLVTYDEKKFDWIADVTDGQYLVFTQY